MSSKRIGESVNLSCLEYVNNSFAGHLLLSKPVPAHKSPCEWFWLQAQTKEGQQKPVNGETCSIPGDRGRKAHAHHLDFSESRDWGFFVVTRSETGVNFVFR